jgi:hypothetical protein
MYFFCATESGTPTLPIELGEEEKVLDPQRCADGIKISRVKATIEVAGPGFFICGRKPHTGLSD